LYRCDNKSYSQQRKDLVVKRYLIIAGLLVIIIIDHHNQLPFMPFWLKTCPSAGSGTAHCIIKVPEGHALAFELTGTGSVGVYGDKGGRLSEDKDFHDIQAFGPGTYEIDMTKGAWAVVPSDWARVLVKS
jgi:hypothetical protein